MSYETTGEDVGAHIFTQQAYATELAGLAVLIEPPNDELKTEIIKHVNAMQTMLRLLLIHILPAIRKHNNQLYLLKS